VFGSVTDLAHSESTTYQYQAEQLHTKLSRQCIGLGNSGFVHQGTTNDQATASYGYDLAHRESRR